MFVDYLVYVMHKGR